MKNTTSTLRFSAETIENVVRSRNRFSAISQGEQTPCWPEPYAECLLFS